MQLAPAPARLRLGLLGLLATMTAAVVPAAAPPAGAASITVPASADAKVALASPNANFGGATTLEVDNSPVMESFVAFDVADPGAPVSRADSAEVMKMPDPIIEPTTIMVASSGPRRRSRVPLSCPVSFGFECGVIAKLF